MEENTNYEVVQENAISTQETQNDESTELMLLGNRSEQFLTDVKKANLLSPTLVEKITALAPELNHVFKTQTIWRTETEIRCSVLNDMNFPDKASKYHQAKLEQLVFFEQLLHLSFDFRKLQQDLAIKEAEILEIQDKLSEPELKEWQVKKYEAELAKKEIEREELAYGIQNMQIQGRERVREVEIWSKIKEELDDGSFDKDNKDQNQLISLTRRYIREAWNAIHVGKGSDISSYNNIIAQFHMLVKECLSRNVFVEMISVYGGPGEPIVDWVCNEFGIRLQAVNPQPQQGPAQGTPNTAPIRQW